MEEVDNGDHEEEEVDEDGSEDDDNGMVTGDDFDGFESNVEDPFYDC